MIAVLIFYSGKLIAKGEIDINNFFSFLAAMMLAYQPVEHSLLLIWLVNQGLSAASRIYQLLIKKIKYNDMQKSRFKKWKYKFKM